MFPTFLGALFFFCKTPGGFHLANTLAAVTEDAVECFEQFVCLTLLNMEVLQNAEGETNKYKPGGRLDMSHGFLHHIRRNQIARYLTT